MSEIAATSFVACKYNYSSIRKKWQKNVIKKQEWQWHYVVVGVKRFRSSSIKNEMAAINSATYSSRISTDIPLYETPGASFDTYLEDKQRVFKTVFPDKRRSQQLNEEEWRIQMLPINFLSLTVMPEVDMRLRCKSGGKDYPPQIPTYITKVLELDITRWELGGISGVLEPSHFSLGVKGALYADRTGEARTRLKGQLEMNISFVLPHALALIPENVRQNVAEAVLTRLLEDMKEKVNGRLLKDYSEFKRGKL